MNLLKKEWSRLLVLIEGDIMYKLDQNIIELKKVVKV